MIVWDGAVKKLNCLLQLPQPLLISKVAKNKAFTARGETIGFYEMNFFFQTCCPTNSIEVFNVNRKTVLAIVVNFYILYWPWPFPQVISNVWLVMHDVIIIIKSQPMETKCTENIYYFTVFGTEIAHQIGSILYKVCYGLKCKSMHSYQKWLISSKDNWMGPACVLMYNASCKDAVYCMFLQEQPRRLLNRHCDLKRKWHFWTWKWAKCSQPLSA